MINFINENIINKSFMNDLLDFIEYKAQSLKFFCFPL